MELMANPQIVILRGPCTGLIATIVQDFIRHARVALPGFTGNLARRDYQFVDAQEERCQKCEQPKKLHQPRGRCRFQGHEQ